MLALLWGPASAQPSAATRATTVPKAIVAPVPPSADQARDLYSARARRLVRNYIQLRLLELRGADFDRVRGIIEGRLGIDSLFSPPPVQGGNRASGR